MERDGVWGSTSHPCRIWGLLLVNRGVCLCFLCLFDELRKSLFASGPRRSPA